MLGLSRNKTFDALAETPARAAPMEKEARHWQSAPLPSAQCAAESWTREEKVVARVEATEPATDARFVVTSLTGRGKHLYEKVCCARGSAENVIKDMKLTTRSDKTECSRGRQATQFRLLLHFPGLLVDAEAASAFGESCPPAESFHQTPRSQEHRPWRFTA